MILRQKQVQTRTGLSRSGIYAAQAAGSFPRSISLGARAVGWLQSEVDAWIADRVAQSRGPVISGNAASHPGGTDPSRTASQ